MIPMASVAVIGSSAAWFANNNQTDTSDLSTNSEVTSNLVIASSVENITKADIGASFDVTLADDGPDLIPAQHHEKESDETVAYPANLRYNSNPREVSSTTGEAKGTTTLAFSPVPVYKTGDENRYYFDQTVYIASSGMALESSELWASMELIQEVTTGDDYLQAATIDFYVDGTYKDTLNVAGQTWNQVARSKTSVLLYSGTIPLNTENYITVLMRCYYDGGLESASGETYVRSNNLSAKDYRLRVNFQAKEQTAASS